VSRARTELPDLRLEHVGMDEAAGPQVGGEESPFFSYTGPMSGGKTLLLMVIYVPVLIGILAGRERRLRPALLRLLLGVLVFDVVYLLILYCLRYRWV